MVNKSTTGGSANTGPSASKRGRPRTRSMGLGGNDPGFPSNKRDRSKSKSKANEENRMSEIFDRSRRLWRSASVNEITQSVTHNSGRPEKEGNSAMDEIRRQVRLMEATQMLKLDSWKEGVETRVDQLSEEVVKVSNKCDESESLFQQIREAYIRMEESNKKLKSDQEDAAKLTLSLSGKVHVHEKEINELQVEVEKIKKVVENPGENDGTSINETPMPRISPSRGQSSNSGSSNFVQAMYKKLENWPSFKGTNDNKHPQVFLNEIEQCFLHVGISEEEKTVMFKGRLQGDALMWMSTMAHVKSYSELKQKFIQKYWSKNVQQALYTRFLSANYYDSKQTPSEFAEYWYGKLQYSAVCADITMFLLTLRDKFPLLLQSLLMGDCMQSYDDFKEKLQEAEMIYLRSRKTSTAYKKPVQVNSDPRVNLIYSEQEYNREVGIQNVDELYNVPGVGEQRGSSRVEMNGEKESSTLN